MKNIVLILLVVVIVGCSNEQEYNTSNSNADEASWAYEFVQYDGKNYILTGKKVEATDKGEKVGEVKRNIVEMDVDANLVEMNFDSNALSPRTPLYQYNKGVNSILYEVNGELFLAEKMPTQELGDLRPMIRVDDTLFFDTGKELSIDMDDIEVIGEVISSVDPSEKPMKNGQTNFGSIGSKYAYYENDIILYTNKWILFEKIDGK